MFGVLKYRGCSQSDEQRNEHRLHYCGTCKTIGSLYGQSSRFLLNHDTVFLSELLSAMSAGPTWARAYQSFNCMTMPAAENMPLQLRIAAHLTIVLTEFKLRDQILDSGFVGWRFAQRIFSSTFERASMALQELSFPLEEFHDLLLDQQKREASVDDIISQNLPAHEIFDYCAAPTAAITGEVFHKSVQAMGHDSQQEGIQARCVGEALGKLVYTIDAFDDFEKDLRQLQFNPLISIGKHAPDFSLETHRQAMFPYVHRQVEAIKHALASLPIADVDARSFFSRLTSNVTERLGAGWQHVCVHSCGGKHHAKHVHQCDANSRLSTATCEVSDTETRWQQSKSFVRNLRANSEKKCGPFGMVAADLTTFAFLSQARQAQDISQVVTIPFNLIAWSSLAMELRNHANRRSPNMVLMSGSTDDPTQPEPKRPRRFGKRFSENPNDQPLPDIIEKPDQEGDQPAGEPGQPHDPEQRPQNPGQRPHDPGRRPQDPGPRYPIDPPYSSRPYYRATGYSCWDQLCMTCGCNCCCNSCRDIDCCCLSLECCGSGGTDCCCGSGAGCCGDGAGCCGGGADCCGGGADCCGGGADCCGGGADCCSGCSCGT